jgi:hypothetical protein
VGVWDSSAQRNLDLLAAAHHRDAPDPAVGAGGTLEVLTARMISPFWKPTLAAAASSAISVTTTPSVPASRCSSSATAGEMLATLAPWNGERVVRVISSRPVSGAVSSATVSFISLPLRCTSICALPPSGRVAKR